MSNQHNTRPGIVPWTAGEAIGKYDLVTVNATAGQVEKTDAAADIPIGIAAESGASGQTIGVIPFVADHELRVKAGASVTKGALLQVDSGLEGGMIPAASGVVARALALESGASGQLIRVFPTYGVGS